MSITKGYKQLVSEAHARVGTLALECQKLSTAI